MDVFNDPRYPRWVYSLSVPKGRLIASETALLKLTGEWFSHPDLRPASKIDLPAPPEPELETEIPAAKESKGKK